MASLLLKILIVLNVMFWIVPRFDTRLSDGEIISVSGFPIPWYSSSVMGTRDVNLSLLFFAIDFFVFLAIVEIFDRITSVTERIGLENGKIVSILLLFAVIPPFSTMASMLILGDWSEFVMIPWSGWVGEVDKFYFTHGLNQ